MNQEEGLKKLREPFPANLISKKPKPTKAQSNCKPDEKKHCSICGQWHHPKVNHLDYVGHAALTDRLLDVDPLWTWEPLAFDEFGLPLFDNSGGLWIKLTICGHTRIGYGNADSKNWASAGDREKEVIGDALRNAGMRFGAALDLWHKGDLNGSNGNEEPEAPPEQPPKQPTKPTKKISFMTDEQRKTLNAKMVKSGLTDADKMDFLEWIDPKNESDTKLLIASFETQLTEWRNKQEAA